MIIMQKAFDNELQIVGSDILRLEMSKIRNEDKRNDVEGLYHALVIDSVTATCEIRNGGIWL